MEGYCRVAHLHDLINIDFMLGMMYVEIPQLLNTTTIQSRVCVHERDINICGSVFGSVVPVLSVISWRTRGRFTDNLQHHKVRRSFS